MVACPKFGLPSHDKRQREKERERVIDRDIGEYSIVITIRYIVCVLFIYDKYAMVKAREPFHT